MEKFELQNGLRVVTERMTTGRSVSIGIWVRTGSRNENDKNNGISHLIEHMLFKGTKRFSAQEIAEVFDSIGGNINAFTSKEYTCYYAKVLDEHLPIAVDVLSDMFFDSLFDEVELQKEKNVIIEEIAMYEDTPDDLVHDLIAEAVYTNHPLGYTILGRKENLLLVEPDDIRAYMNSHYHIHNTVISVAGNIDDSIRALLEQYFGQFNIKGEADKLVVPNFDSNFVFREKKTEQNHLCLAVPGFSYEDERLFGMILLNNIIGGGMSSRLFQEIREKRGLAYSIYSYHSAYTDNGTLTIYAGTHPNQTKDVLDITMELMADLIASGISDAELNKGKQQLKGSLILGLESTSSWMNRLGKNELITQKHLTLDEVIGKIESISMEQIKELTRTVFSQPFSAALVGQSDQSMQGFRRDQLVL